MQADAHLQIGPNSYSILIVGPIAHRGGEVWTTNHATGKNTMIVELSVPAPGLSPCNWDQSVVDILARIVYHEASLALENGQEDE